MTEYTRTTPALLRWLWRLYLARRVRWIEVDIAAMHQQRDRLPAQIAAFEREVAFYRVELAQFQD